MPSSAQNPPEPTEELVLRARAALGERCGVVPAWIATAPGRVNLIGEHTDYHDGLVLPMAIDRACVIAAAPAHGPTTIVALDLNDAWRGDPAAFTPSGIPASVPTWARYPLGTIIELARLVGRPPPALDLAITSSIPKASGLSSSAALEVATALICLEAMGERLDPWPMIHACQRAERVHLGVPCGVMDQACVTLAQQGTAVLIDCASWATRAVAIPAHAAVLVIDTNTPRALADGRYAAVRQASERARQTMAIPTLRHADDAMIARFASQLTRGDLNAVRHVVAENARVDRFVAALRTGDLPRAGEVMHESHRSLRDVLGVSCDELDLVVHTAMGLPGVYGSRMTGAGFGGCAIALVDPARADAIAAAIRERFMGAFARPCNAWLATPSRGASLVRCTD